VTLPEKGERTSGKTDVRQLANRLAFAAHLINTCGVPDWIGTGKRETES
jgi:hypothetical protein